MSSSTMIKLTTKSLRSFFELTPKYIQRSICTSCIRNQEIQGGLPSHPGEVPGGPSHQMSAPLGRRLPLMTSRKLEFPSHYSAPKQAWIETLETTENDKLGIVDLHPDIFGVFPRTDILWWNIHWQRLYKFVDYNFAKNRAEMRGGGKKPWQQKGTGRARHGSNKSPLWIGGGKVYGPRGPKSHFYMLSMQKRVLGLRTALSVKYAQDNLHIVDTLDIPSDEPGYLKDVIESKGWGLSVLFVEDSDVIPRNFAVATDKIKPYTSMPVYGLNVYSMLKHETLVLTVAALEKIEHKLLKQVYHPDHRCRKFDQKTAHLFAQPYNPKAIKH